MNISFLKNITTKGIKPGMNASDEKIVLITNYILLLASIVAFGRVFVFYFSRDLVYSSISIAATILFMVAYFMNTKGYYDFAKFFLMIVGNSATCYKELSNGGDGNQLYLIIAGFMIAFLLFSFHEKVKLIIALIIPSINFVLCVFFSNIFSNPIILTPEIYNMDKIFGSLSAVVIIILSTWYFVKKSTDAEKRLIKSNSLLKNLYDEIFNQKSIIEELLYKSDKLLLNVLPSLIANRLKEGETLIADHFEEASIIFIDIANFTRLTSNSTPENIVKELNRIFTYFDKISGKYKIEKIKTLGDCYMAAAGIPEPRHDHADVIAKMAIEIIDIMKDYVTEDGIPLNFRIGIDCGPVVAGVIGEQKFIYDLWGDPVNTASRMEDYGAIGKIHCTERFKSKVESQKSKVDQASLLDTFNFEERGEIEIKGKGMMRTYFLEKN